MCSYETDSQLSKKNSINFEVFWQDRHLQEFVVQTMFFLCSALPTCQYSTKEQAKSILTSIQFCKGWFINMALMMDK
jgi:hypothetical protein